MPEVQYVSIDSERLVVDATAGGVTFTAAKALTPKVVRAVCRVETAEIRIQTAPPATVVLTAGGAEGSPIKAVNDEFVIHGSPDLRNFRAIRTTVTSGNLQVIYEGYTS